MYQTSPICLLKGSRKKKIKIEETNDREGDETQHDSTETENCHLEEADSCVTSNPSVCNTPTIKESFSLNPPPPQFSPAVGGFTSRSVLPQRPSVIKRTGREEPSKLLMQAEILKFHGNILTHTGDCQD